MISNKQPSITLQGTRKRTKSKVSRRKEIIKIRAKIKEIEKRKTTEKIMKT